MKQNRKSGIVNKNLWLFVLLAGLLMPLSACGMSQDPLNETGREESKRARRHESDVITVEVLVESDHDSAVDLEVDINARKNPQSIRWDTIKLPYQEKFVIPKDTFIPLISTHVKAGTKGDEGWISCSILYDGELVASHKSRGSEPKAVCEKKFHLGPG